MLVRKMTLIYFSPTGNVAKTVRSIADGTGMGWDEIDLTRFDARWGKYQFGPDELVVFGFPVYGGRIPAIASECLRCIEGSSTPAVFVVSYGNRDYEDALFELSRTFEPKGFQTIASAAFIGEHSICETIAKGRPDDSDRKVAFDFGRAVIQKLESVFASEQLSRVVPAGHYPYRAYSESSEPPETDENCVACGLCARECPMQAVNPENPGETDAIRCLKCCRCIHLCPQSARHFRREKVERISNMLTEKASARKEPILLI